MYIYTYILHILFKLTSPLTNLAYHIQYTYTYLYIYVYIFINIYIYTYKYIYIYIFIMYTTRYLIVDIYI
jgi:hypothetical protein